MSAHTYDLVGLGQANDLSNEEIQGLWVPFSESVSDSPFFKPASAMATIVLGGKGSGKTHLLRYFSFPVQPLRYTGSTDWTEHVLRDGYVGIYARAGGLDANRFCGKGVLQEQWTELFFYYLELWLAQALLEVTARLASHIPELRAHEQDTVKRCTAQFHRRISDAANTFGDLARTVEDMRRRLDGDVNDVVFTNILRPEINCSSGTLIFGIPAIIHQHVPVLRHVTFCYYMDEYENFNEWQQKHFNTLLRERRPPVTFRVGARMYGMKTYATHSGNEELKEGSEFHRLRLDDRLRNHAKNYKIFAKALLDRRISGWAGPRAAREIEDQFRDTAETTHTYISGSPRPEPPSDEPPAHAIRRKLKGIANHLDTEAIVNCLSYASSPIVEKAALYAFYQAYSKGSTDLLAIAACISQMKATALTDEQNRLHNLLKHFGDDFRAQLLRSRRQRFKIALTLEDIITMSEGLPRVFLTIMKHIFSWAEFERGQLSIGDISPFAIRRGVIDAALWFQHDMPQAGPDGAAIITCVARVAELFRLNRYSDKPTECSLIAFSTPVDGVSEVARSRLRDSEHRSFLIRIPSGERDRNSKQVRPKYQLNRLLCVLFGLPIARRGTARFSAGDIDAIFGSDNDDLFRTLRLRWSNRLNWPFGRRGAVSGCETQDPQVYFDWG